MNGFEGFATDVTGYSSPGGGFDVGRSIDGSTLTTRTAEGLGGPPLLVVQTDATAFDDLGATTYRAMAEFPLRDVGDEGWAYRPIISQIVDLPGTFRPVPEPGTAGVAVVALSGVALRRCRRGSRPAAAKATTNGRL